GKVRTHEYFEHVLLRERIIWVPLKGSLRIVVNSKPLKIQAEWEPVHDTTVRPNQVDTWFEEDLPKPPVKRPLTAGERAIMALAATPATRSRYRNAWTLMDRIHDADDSGERLFRYLRDNRPDINAWFVLERGTPDWKRLERDGYRSRMVPHGTRQWKLLMLNCVHLISTHADAPVHRPPAIVRMIKPAWKFTFLQHGVIKDDLSRWLNPKGIDLFVTSTPQEQASIAGDETPYAYTSKEAKMTGLPRFDRLREVGAEVPPESRDLILVSPTWRSWLNPPLDVDSQRRGVYDAFFASEYVQQWLAFLNDERLRDLTERTGTKVGFLPHPNIQPALSRMDLPPHVEAIAFAGNDVQQVMARAAVMVTDYSSMAFNAAYIDRPVVYFQFDAKLALEGAHVGRPGYFEYERDGFGPVATVAADAVTAAIDAVTADGKRPSPAYQARIDATFTERDGRCCERTTAAIEAMTPPTPKRSLPRRVAGRLARSPRVKRLARSRALRPVVESPKLRRMLG
ncbi:MAG: CDP-glycerol glycerophosphotransferase family protein, partial [Jatrophihabitantaceae bacterium]